MTRGTWTTLERCFTSYGRRASRALRKDAAGTLRALSGTYGKHDRTCHARNVLRWSVHRSRPSEFR